MTMKQLKNGRYIVGVSGGADSMALLSMCHKDKHDLIVAHVNYQKRESANRDEQIVKEYCLKNGIPFHVSSPIQKSKGNFQDWARKVRLDFFKELYSKYDADGLLLAHHQDDLLETYLIQQERNAKVEFYGIAEETIINEMKVYRPLLGCTKQDLLVYVKKNNISYGIDESNLSDVYLRNRIRNNEINSITAERRQELLKEIEIKNDKLLEYQRKVAKNVEVLLNKWSRKKFEELDSELRKDVLRLYIKKHNIDVSSYSDSYLEHLVNCCLSPNNHRELLENGMVLDQCYGVVYIHFTNEAYKYVITEMVDIKTPYFEIKTTNGASVEAVFVQIDDFPLTIRSPMASDEIVMRFGTKKINRWFIDRKIPLWERECWPIVLNVRNEIILVPKIGCNVEHYNVKPNLFVIK